MRRATLKSVLIAALLLATLPLQAQDEGNDPYRENRDFDLGGAIGFNAGPTNFAAALFGDLYVSRFLSAKAFSEMGFWQGRSFYILTAGGEFHFPIESVVLPGFEFNFATTAGYFLRREGGLSFHNFIMIAGPGADYYLGDGVALTTSFLVNVSNDPVRDLFYTGLIGAKYIF